MPQQEKNNGKNLGLWTVMIASIVAMALPAAVASAVPPNDGGIYRLGPESMYQHGCFDPCMCPLQTQAGVYGAFKLVPLGTASGYAEFAVQDVNWSVPITNSTVNLRIIGQGKYTIGSPDPTTVVKHRMELDLKVGDEPVQHFDSGWLPLENFGDTRIRITVSMNNMECFDTVLTIEADIVPPNEIVPYMLIDSATFQRGCWDPCDCPLGSEVPMAGSFALVQVYSAPLFLTEFAVVNIDWRVRDTSVANSIPIRGIGVYQIIGDFVAQHRLALDLTVGNEPRAHFDSGVLFGGSFPRIDAVVSQNGMVCLDTVLHVIGDPVSNTCGGIAGLPCGGGEFCKTPTGHCYPDATGVCTPIPNGCPTIWNPVCGCDGVTYGNECEAEMAAVSIAHYGECAPFCGTDADCPAANQFCKFPEGNCGVAALPGRCTTIPNACPDVWDPVCGCDGVTYGNECEANMARVSIALRGPCEHPCSEVQGLPPCASALFCLYPEGTCDNGIDTGICAAIPGICPGVWAPVCGCDGVTYGNECEAHAAGVSVRSRSECPRSCGNSATDPPCALGEFCKFPTGTCNDPNASGVCTEIPTGGCPENYSPVCGCDGITYGNKCEADAAAVSIDYLGECSGTVCSATRQILPSVVAYCHHGPLTIRIAVTPPSGTTIVALEDSPPAGWGVTDISHNGTFDSANWKVKWGPFFAPDIPTAVTYKVYPVNDQNVTACFEGTMSLDGLSEQICGQRCVQVSCPPFMAADMPQPPCPACPIGDCTAQPNGSCRDGRITLYEVIGYACAWKHSCNDDLNGMARAAYIWRNGECYCWEETEANWFPNSCPPPASGYCPTGNGTAPAAGTSAFAGGKIIVNRSRAGDRRQVQVEVRFAPPDGATTMAFEIDVADGWNVSNVSNDGQWDGNSRKIKWGPFFDDVSPVATFDLARDQNSRSLRRSRPLSRKVTARVLNGRVSFDGVMYPISVR